MKFRDILNLVVLFVVGLFAVIKLGGIGRIIGLALIATGLVWLIITLVHNGVIKLPGKKSKKDETEEIIRHTQEIEKLEKYDVDSGLGYCAHCGSYSVKDGVCEVCGEKETE